ncbi:S8 family serine peptidase [Draconibacterium sp.]
MSKFIFYTILSFFLLQSVQTKAQDYYWLAFTDKNSSGFSLSTPEEYLSERAIERRAKQKIVIDSLDLPVNQNYISGVLNLGVEFVHASKWLNGITVKTEIDSFPAKVLQLSFVKSVQLSKPKIQAKSAFDKFQEYEVIENSPIDTSLYGQSVYQTSIMNGQFLHNQDYLGQGIQIAVIDAGFLNADKYPAFDSLWANNQILGTKDFVDPNSDIFSTHYHGMSVLSCMGGNVPGKLIGTAPEASFWLLRSEDVNSEYLIEEDNWVAAAEFADSAGVDIINSSLGYTTFNDASMNHTYADIDGKTTRITHGANIAASRGILVFSSAGNDGNKAWKYISPPADGENVIAVGAVNKDSIAAPFSSYGPAFGGAIKPNVTAIGWNTYLQLSSGNFGFSNGTSFSSPVMAGMAACLWQAFPNATSKQVKQVLEISGHLFEKPDVLMGFGIPDMQKAHFLLMNSYSQFELVSNQWKAFPNPVGDFLILQKDGSKFQGKINIEIYSIDGKLLQKREKQDAPRIELNNLNILPNGILLLKISTANYTETVKLSKVQ